MFEDFIRWHKSFSFPQYALEHVSCRTSLPWQPITPPLLQRRALEVIHWIAERMRHVTRVEAIAQQAQQQSSGRSRWDGPTLSAGFSGVAMMYGYMARCFPGQGWEAVAHKCFRVAAAGTHFAPLTMPGICRGSSGMALAFSELTGGAQHQTTLARLHGGIYEQVIQRTWHRSGADGGVADRDYDVISGAAGVLAYLASIKQPDESIQTAIAHLLPYLLWIAEPGQPLGKERWYVPAHLLSDRYRTQYPHGYFNCGFAHGIPGPLAALALTWLAGYRYPGLRESIAYLSDWIILHRANDAWGINWPTVIPSQLACSSKDWNTLPGARAAWCYGAPGVGRSLWLAGQALDDMQVRRIAIEAIEATLRRPGAIPSAHLCHGRAGLLQICLRFAHECESLLIREYIPVLVEQILDLFDADTALGFRDLDGEPVDQPGWLTGAPGIAMVLLAASTSAFPTWDRALVIA